MRKVDLAATQGQMVHFLVRSCRSRLSIPFLLAVACAVPAWAQTALESGRPLQVNIGPGLLASPNAYKTIPLGAARVLGHRRADLFVHASRGIDCGLYLYGWLRDNATGQPVFAPPIRLKHPFGDGAAPEGTIAAAADGIVHGLWLRSGKLVDTRFDLARREFRRMAEIDIRNLPHSPGAVGLMAFAAHGLQLVISGSNGRRYRPPGDSSSNDYVLYDGTGAFRGGWPYDGLYRLDISGDLSKVTQPLRLASQAVDEIRGGATSIVAVEYSADCRGAIAGSPLGNLYFFPREKQSPDRFEKKRPLVDPSHRSIRHPTQGASPIVYPGEAGRAVDLIVGGEGSLYYYRFTGNFAPGGEPVYAEAEPVWQDEAPLYAGSLAVPNAIDWDGDGACDLVVGNSEGRVLFFKNRGTNLAPRFGIGDPLWAGDEPIHVQPGYYGIQGPMETRWGYACPAVADWNGDGLPDLLLSSATARHEVFLNAGTRQSPRLAPGRPLYCDGLELHGVWRVRPGVAAMDGRMAYIIQDDGNALRRYWRIDDYNVEDGGRLKLCDGSIITAHTEGADTGPGQTGRGSRLGWRRPTRPAHRHRQARLHSRTEGGAPMVATAARCPFAPGGLSAQRRQ